MARRHVRINYIAKTSTWHCRQINGIGKTAFIKAAPTGIAQFKTQAIPAEATFYGLIGVQFHITAGHIEGQNIQVAVAIHVIHCGVIDATHVELRPGIIGGWNGSDIIKPATKIIPCKCNVIVFIFAGICHDAIHAGHVGVGENVHHAIIIVIAQQYPVLYFREVSGVFGRELVGSSIIQKGQMHIAHPVEHMQIHNAVIIQIHCRKLGRIQSTGERICKSFTVYHKFNIKTREVLGDQNLKGCNNKCNNNNRNSHVLFSDYEVLLFVNCDL